MLDSNYANPEKGLAPGQKNSMAMGLALVMGLARGPKNLMAMGLAGVMGLARGQKNLMAMGLARVMGSAPRRFCPSGVDLESIEK